MSAVLGEGLKSWVLKFLIWTVAVTFVGSAFLMYDWNQSVQDETVATIAGEPVTKRELAETRDQIDANLRRQLGGQVDPGTLKSLNTPMMALNSIIARRLQLAAAKEAGLSVSEMEVRDAIMSMKDFQVNGAFDGNRYLEIMKRSGIKPSSFEEGLKSDILQQKIVAMIERVAMVPDFEARNNYLFENQAIAVDYVKISPAEFEAKIAVSDDDLRKWFEGRKNDFKEPENRSFRLLTLDAGAFERKIALSDEDAAAYYAAHNGEFEEKTELHVRHILVPAPVDAKQEEIAAAGDKIRKAAARIKEGEDFAKVAKEVSGDPASARNGGDLGTFKLGTMAPEFEKAVVDLMPGEISQPFSTQFGVHIAQLISKKPARVPPLEEVKTKVEAAAKRDKAKKDAFALMQSIASSAKPETFASVADAHPEIRINTYTLPKNGAVPGFSDSKKIMDVIFSLKEKDVSGALELAEGYAIAVVDGIRPPIIPLFETVKQKAADVYKADQAAKLAEEEASRIEKAVKGGKPLGLVAKESGRSVTRTAPFSRSDMAAARQSGVEGMTSEAFGLADGDARVIPSHTGFVIMSLAERPPLDEQGMSAKLPEITKTLQKTKRERVYSEFLTNLRKKAEERGEIKINPGMEKTES